MTDLTLNLRANGINTNNSSYNLDLTQEQTIQELADRWEDLNPIILDDMLDHLREEWQIIQEEIEDLTNL